jgi:hypothetical protein
MTDSINQRFARAWESVDNPPLDSVNPHFKNKFASLGATLKCIRKACKDNGITYHQAFDTFRSDGEAEATIRTWVSDGNGGRIDLSCMRFPITDNPQQLGSAMTYCRRYVAQLDWGILGEEDDDAERAMPQQDAPRSKPVQAKRQAKKKVLFKDTRLFKECASLGVKPDGMEKWYASKPFANKTIDELNDFEMGQVKAYLQEMKDSAQQVL